MGYEASLDTKLLLPSQDEVNAVLARRVTDLPMLPLVVLKLLHITSDEKASLSDLERLVETEPTILAKMLRMVNSAAFGLHQRISNVREAIQHVGFRAVRTLALEVTLFEQMVSPSRLFHFDRIHFWQHCLSVACLSKALAQEAGHPDPDEVYVAGLLHDIGKIIIDVYGRIPYSEFLASLPATNGLLVEEEQQIIGLGHDRLGAYFCHEWALPQSFTLAVRFHHERFDNIGLPARDSLLVSIVSLANLIAWTQGIGSVTVLRHPVLQPEVAARIDIEQISLRGLLARMDVDVKSIADFYNFSFPSAETFRENLLRATINLSRKNTEFHYQHEELQKKVESLASMKKSVAVPHQSLDPDQILCATLEAVHREFGYDRLHILIIDDKKRCLVVSQSIDATSGGNELVGNEIEVTPGSDQLISCLRSKSPILVTGSGSGDRLMLERFGVHEIGLVPITSNEQVLGLIAVDNFATERQIETADLSSVSIVASELGMALERARLFEKYRVKASFDDLTGLHNRGPLNELLGACFVRACAGEDLSVAMIDIDFFKRFNDSYGHLAGDSVLKLLASALRRFSRPADHVGRFGGEEFLVILPDTGFESAILYGDRLRREVEKLGRLLLKRFRGHPLTISVGICTFEPELHSKEDLIAKADEALYSAKRLGRNRVVGICGPVRKFAP